MIVLHIVYACLFVSLCVLASAGDIRHGIIKNKMLAIYLAAAVVIDAIYNGCFVREGFMDFVANVLIVAVLSLLLFYTHSIAGGDAKLFIVLSVLYPWDAYLYYNDISLTLYLVIFAAVFWGYLYLIGVSFIRLITRKNKITRAYITSSIKSFAFNYLRAIIFISLINLFFYGLCLVGLPIEGLVTSLACFAVAWLVGRVRFFRMRAVVAVAFLMDVAVSIYLNVIPISTNIKSYALVAVLMLCQMTVRTNLYSEISVGLLKKGMILSAPSTMLFLNSRVRGLPKISTEDLKSRISQEEVESIQRWAEGGENATLVIVKKIPFAVFISLGYLNYFLLRSAIR